MCGFELPNHIALTHDIWNVESSQIELSLAKAFHASDTKSRASCWTNPLGDEYPFDAYRYCQARVSTICTFTRRSGGRFWGCSAHGAIGSSLSNFYWIFSITAFHRTSQTGAVPTAERALNGFKEQRVRTRSDIHQSEVGRHKTNGERGLSVPGTSKSNKHRPVPLKSTSYFTLPSKPEIPGNDALYTSTIVDLHSGSV
jgi:hypothetical protein